MKAVGWITVMLLFLIYFCAVLTTGLLGRNESVSDSAPFPLLSQTLCTAVRPGAFLQILAPTLDIVSGPMSARFPLRTGLGFGTLIGRAEIHRG